MKTSAFLAIILVLTSASIPALAGEHPKPESSPHLDSHCYHVIAPGDSVYAKTPQVNGNLNMAEEGLSSLDDRNVELMNARAVPFYEKGKITGYKLFGIKPHGLYSKIGLKNGDILLCDPDSEKGQTGFLAAGGAPISSACLVRYLSVPEDSRLSILRDGKRLSCGGGKCLSSSPHHRVVGDWGSGRGGSDP